MVCGYGRASDLSILSHLLLLIYIKLMILIHYLSIHTTHTYNYSGYSSILILYYTLFILTYSYSERTPYASSTVREKALKTHLRSN